MSQQALIKLGLDVNVCASVACCDLLKRNSEETHEQESDEIYYMLSLDVNVVLVGALEDRLPRLGLADWLILLLLLIIIIISVIVIIIIFISSSSSSNMCIIVTIIMIIIVIITIILIIKIYN